MGLLYTKMKVFHFPERLSSLPLAAGCILPPLHVRIKPTNACNHNCAYCAYKAEGLQLGQEMNKRDFIPREKMLGIVDDLAGMGVKAVTFSGGGEPFIYPYLLDAVRKLAPTPIRFAALTNGANLKGELAEIFAQRATWLRISCDGWDGPSYAAYRKVGPGAFAQLLKNMESFKKLGGRCLLSVSLIVDQRNAAHVFEFLERMKDLGVDSAKVSPCIVSNLGAENQAYHRPIFEKVKEQIGRAVEDLHSLHFEIFDAYHELGAKFAKAYTWCPFLQILPVIGADMNVYSCQDKAYTPDGLLGSIKEQSFKKFWYSDKNNFFKINPSRDCNHHCVANEKNRLIHEYLDADREHLGFV
jgi:MoaA/NifB/PqqE/SkfB family radical SAM enzyme